MVHCWWNQATQNHTVIIFVIVIFGISSRLDGFLDGFWRSFLMGCISNSSFNPKPEPLSRLRKVKNLITLHFCHQIFKSNIEPCNYWDFVWQVKCVLSLKKNMCVLSIYVQEINHHWPPWYLLSFISADEVPSTQSDPVPWAPQNMAFFVWEGWYIYGTGASVKGEFQRPKNDLRRWKLLKSDLW